MTLKSPDFDTVITAARLLLSSGGALYLTWKGRAKWEPSDIDVPRLPQQLVGLLSAVLLAWISLNPHRTRDFNQLLAWSGALSVLCVVAGLLYLFITKTSVYYRLEGNRRIRIIGGFQLTPAARVEIKRHKPHLTVQEYLETKAKNKPDRVWPRRSRAAMQVLFVVCYITLSVAGTGALSFVSQALINHRSAPHPLNTPKPVEPPALTRASQAPAQGEPSPQSAPPAPADAPQDRMITDLY